MCSQIWKQIATPSTLSVVLQDDDEQGTIRGTLQIRTPAGNTEITELDRGDFPLHVPLAPGVRCGVTVRLVSDGASARVTVKSEVTGAGPRGPDLCPIAVDASHEVAAASVIANAEG